MKLVGTLDDWSTRQLLLEKGRRRKGASAHLVTLPSSPLLVASPSFPSPLNALETTQE